MLGSAELLFPSFTVERGLLGAGAARDSLGLTHLVRRTDSERPTKILSSGKIPPISQIKK